MQVSESENSNAPERTAQKPVGFMAELDEWTQDTIVAPLYEAWREVEDAPEEEYSHKAQAELLEIVITVKKAVRAKVLESYRNGQKAGPRDGGPRR